MKILLNFAKASIAFVWIILILNMVMPFPGKAAIALYIMAVFLFMMHALQLLIFLGAFGDKLSLSRWEKWSVLIFGIFSLLEIRQKKMR